MPGQDFLLHRTAAALQQGQALLHFSRTAAGEIRASAGARKQRVATEKQPIAGQADAALVWPGVW